MTEGGGKLLGGKVAVITGGASGIGAATARLFARHGASVAIADLNEAAAVGVAGECTALGVAALGLKMDVTDETSVEAAMSATVGRLGRINIVVNSAGISLRHPSMEMPLDVWDKVFAVNVRGTFLASRTAARQMRTQGSGGTVVNLASIMSYSGFGFYPNPAYQASKGAVLNLTRAQAVEWAPLKIRVNAVAPTWVRTPLVKSLLENAETMARLREVTPMQRVAEPEEVAEAILFLAGPQSSMTTGHTLAVDGGFLAQ